MSFPTKNGRGDGVAYGRKFQIIDGAKVSAPRACVNARAVSTHHEDGFASISTTN
jgi:hypothetical protein